MTKSVAESSSAPTGVRETADSTWDRRRHKIVQEAATLFDAVGYHQASMEALADVVGLAKPTLYHYFSGGKEEILYCIHQEFIELLIERQEARLGEELPADRQLLEVMSDILELMETHRGHVRVFFEHHMELPTEWQDSVRERRDYYSQSVEDLLRRGIDERKFQTANVRLAALTIFGACNWAYQWYRVDGSLSPREIAFFIFGTLYRGLAADG